MFGVSTAMMTAAVIELLKLEGKDTQQECGVSRRIA